MKKYIALTYVIWGSIGSFAQSNYELANFYFERGHYRIADSIYSIEIKARTSNNSFEDVLLSILGISEPINKLYYNKGVARLYMKDTASFCYNLNLAVMTARSNLADNFQDTLAEKHYQKLCIARIDTTYLTRKYEPTSREDSKLYDIIRIERYSNFSKGEIINPKLKGHIVRQNNFNNAARGYKKSTVARYFINKRGDKYYYQLVSMPKYPGGLMKYETFLKKNLLYPDSKLDACRKFNSNKKVIYIPCIVNEHGKISLDTEISPNYYHYIPNEIAKPYIKEAENVLLKITELIPAKFNKQPVSSFIYLPVTYIFN